MGSVRTTKERSPKLLGWQITVFVTIVALFLRLRNLGEPRHVMFDETYYAKDAWSLLKFGYSRDAVEDANELISAGGVADAFTSDPTWIVHPDGGKWMIAIGQWIFGMNATGWRFSAAIAGTLLVLVLIRLIGRLTGSWLIAGAMGFLLAIDGVGLVMSRIALLDIFLALWLLSMVSALVADRDWLAARLDRSRVPWIRPWQITAGVCAGLAVSTKWSALWPIAAFGITVVIWELALRGHLAELRKLFVRALRVGIPAFVSLVGVGFVVYLATWSSWLANHEVFEDRFGHGYGDIQPWSHLESGEASWSDPLLSLWEFHKMTYDFHTGDYLSKQTHPYQSNPAGWLIQKRPTSVDTATDIPAEECGAAVDSSCIREVLILGNPVIWWATAASLVLLPIVWWRTRSWRWSVPIVGVLATWLPWFFVGSRPIYSFYAVTVIPFSLLGLGMLLGYAYESHKWRRLVIAGIIGLLLISAVVSWWFWPVWTNEILPYDEWRKRMWFDSWI